MRIRRNPAATGVAVLVLAVLVPGTAAVLGAAPQRQLPDMNARFMADSGKSWIEIGVRTGIAYVPLRIRAGNMTFFYDPEHPERTSATVMLDAGTLTSGEEELDGVLKSADWLDVDNHSHIVFQSTGIERTTDGDFMTGHLTIKGYTRPVRLTIDRITDVLRDNQSRLDMVNFAAHTSIDRKDFEMGMEPMWNQHIIGDYPMVGDEIEIRMHVTGYSFTAEFLEQRFRRLDDAGELHPVARLFDAVVENGAQAGKELYRELQARHPEAIDNTTLSDAGWYLMLSGYHQQAIDIFNASINEAPEYTMTYLRQGDAYVFAGEPDKAIHNYMEMWDHYPTLPHIPEMLRLLGVENPTERR